MGNLFEFLRYNERLPLSGTLETRARHEKSKQAFDNLVDFLINPDFSNQEIRKLMTLTKGLTHNMVVWFEEGQINHFTFDIYPRDNIPYFVYPKDFVDSLHDQPLSTVADVVFAASLARDFVTGRISDQDKDPYGIERASAFKAETITSLLDMEFYEEESKEKSLGEKSLEYQIDDQIADLLDKFPIGIKSLEGYKNYPTPYFEGVVRTTIEVQNQAMLATQKGFVDALEKIKKSKIKRISDTAKSIEAKLDNQEAGIIFDPGLLEPFPVELVIYQDPDKKQALDKPGIKIKTAYFLAYPKSILQDMFRANLVRIFEIVDRYPFGFANRQKEIYTEALDMEARWLASEKRGEITYDPRYMPREELIKMLL